MDIGPPMYKDWNLYKCKLHTFGPMPILQFALEIILTLWEFISSLHPLHVLVCNFVPLITNLFLLKVETLQYNLHCFQKWFQHGIGEKWQPMWKYCHPCLEAMEPNSIIRLENINEDKDFVFSTVGLDYTFQWEKPDISNNPEFAFNEQTQKK